jgi:hypothetical protein
VLYQQDDISLSVISVRQYKVIIRMGYIYSYIRREEEFE